MTIGLEFEMCQGGHARLPHGASRISARFPGRRSLRRISEIDTLARGLCLRCQRTAGRALPFCHALAGHPCAAGPVPLAPDRRMAAKLDRAGLQRRPCCLPSLKQRRHPGLAFRGSMAGPCDPLPALAGALADTRAPLGADAVRHAFIAVDFHHLLLAGLPAHLKKRVFRVGRYHV